jgi:hypothetical protein
MSIRNVVLYSNPADPVADVLARAGRATCIHTDALVPYLHRGSWPQPIHADFPADIKALFHGANVFNRVFNHNQTKLADRLAEWRLHTLWGDRPLTQLVLSGASRWHDVSIRGVSRSSLPLNTQWFLLANRTDRVTFPKFVYGFGRVQPDLHDFHDPMQKSVWSLFDWREERQLGDGDRNWHKFFVDRPTGTPVICFYVESSLGFIFPRGEISVDTALFTEVAKHVADTFDSRMGEFLTFMEDDGRMMFCAFSPQMQSAHLSGKLDSMLMRAIDKTH